MIIYSNTVDGFMKDVLDGIVVDTITENLKTKGISTSDSEIKSWFDSTKNMRWILKESEIPKDVDVFIEYNIPFTNSRIDFCIAGYNQTEKNTAIIIELKGWSEGIHRTDMEGIIHADFYGRDVLHPSYQAWSYANYLTNFNSEIVDGQIEIIPCTYLYNMYAQTGEIDLEDRAYSYYTEKARIYYHNDELEFSHFIGNTISRSDNGQTMDRIENGKLTVSASLQKSLRSVLRNKDFFAPMERQRFIYDTVLKGIRKNYRNRKKTVYIIRGGPGTGKSVLALKLLSQLNGGFGDGKDNGFIHALYVTKTSAPRATYSRELKSLANDLGVEPLFKGASSFVDCDRNECPVILVDEAHRLASRSSQFSKGKDQVREIINAALISVFFIDEDQSVSMQDIGTIDRINDTARALGAEVVSDGLVLETQFRCKGSGLYIAWVDDVLGIRKSKDLELLGTLPYEIEVVFTPEDLVSRIKKKRSEGFNSRIVAGYCWDWKTNGKKGGYDITFDNSDLELRWNTSTDVWGNNEDYCEEIGCIHSSQGLEYQYGGVIIGPDMRYEGGEVITDPTARSDVHGTLSGWKKDPERADSIIRNTYRTLMTRGMYGCIVYCVDENLGRYIESRLKQFDYCSNRKL